jgi:hypothetical protein
MLLILLPPLPLSSTVVVGVVSVAPLSAIVVGAGSSSTGAAVPSSPAADTVTIKFCPIMVLFYIMIMIAIIARRRRRKR